MSRFVELFCFSVFIASCSQVILKMSAKEEHKNKVAEYLNVKVIVAYMFFFISSFLTLVAYKEVPLSVGAILEATGYIWVTILGRIVLKEKINLLKGIGLILIVAGVIVYT